MKLKCGFLLGLCIIWNCCYAYSDISSSHWAYNDLMSLSEQSIVSGYPDGSFQPEKQISKAEFLSLLQKTLFADADVSDVSEKWYDGIYQFFISKNLLNQYSFSEDKLQDPIRRAEAAEAFVYCFSKAKQSYLEDEYTGKSIFSDTFGERENKLATIMTETNILQGYPDKTIRWREAVSRAEMVCMFSKLLHNKDELANYSFKKAKPIYEDNYVITANWQMYPELQPYQYDKQEHPVTTKLINIELIKSIEDIPEEYQDIFLAINIDQPYYRLKKEKLDGNNLIIVEFETINHSDQYSVATGADYLRLGFPGRDDIKIIDRFDTNEFIYVNQNALVKNVRVMPNSKHKTTAVYVVNDLTNKIRFHRDVTTMYSETEYIHTTSFQALTVCL